MLQLPALLNIAFARNSNLLMHHPIVVANLLLDFKDLDFLENMKNLDCDIEVRAKDYEKK